MLKIATWNINSVRLRLPLIAHFVAAENPDIIALQETKCHDAVFPLKGLHALGYKHVAIAGQKGYHGVAIASRLPFEETRKDSFCIRGEARHIGVTLKTPSGKSLIIDNLYIPAGGDIPDRALNPKFEHKLSFYERLTEWSSGLDGGENRILLGDFNIAPHENDVWNHRHMLKVVSHTPVEIEAIEKLKSAYPWDDTIRRFIPETEKLFSWWSYRAKDWQSSNRGLRLDHIWASPALKERARSARIIYDWRNGEKPSDHVPAIAEYEI